MATNRIVIVGAGAAGVFTAYRLREMYGTRYEIVLLEAGDRIGGNTSSTTVKYGGKSYNIDCGAQFFYKTPQPSYTALVEQLGLMDDASEIISAPAGFTIWDQKTNARRLWLPSQVSGFLLYEPSDWDRLIKFGTYMGYAAVLDRQSNNWGLSVDDWFASLHLLDDSFKEKVLKPFMYQFVSLPLARMGEASALYAVTYFVRNVFGTPNVADAGAPPPSLPGLPTFQTYQSMIGLDGILKKVLARAHVVPVLNSPVTKVSRVGDVIAVGTATAKFTCDHVIFACDPHAAATALQAGGTADAALVDILRGMEYVGLPISMQKGGSCWMPSDKKYWEPVNTIVDNKAVMFSAWFGPLRPTYGTGQKIPVFKTWGAPDIKGASCPKQFVAKKHFILLPTTKFVGLRTSLKSWQGKKGVWFAGGWTQWFDSQEAALDSATSVVEALPGQPAAFTGRARMIAVDHARIDRNLRTWLERVARHAPEDRRAEILRIVDDVESQG